MMMCYVGDWVRFYRNGELVLGEVIYIRQDKTLNDTYYCTDRGEVEQDDVLERRRKP